MTRPPYKPHGSVREAVALFQTIAEPPVMLAFLRERKRTGTFSSAELAGWLANLVSQELAQGPNSDLTPYIHQNLLRPAAQQFGRPEFLDYLNHLLGPDRDRT